MKVIVAIDSSPYSYEVIEAVGKRLWPEDCEFRVMTRTEPCHNWDTEQQYLTQSQIILDERKTRLKNMLPGHKVVAEAGVGHPASAIISAAAEWRANLIVLGSHGDTGPRKSQIGSVAAAVVNEAPCSVELIKVGHRAPLESTMTALQSAAS